MTHHSCTYTSTDESWCPVQKTLRLSESWRNQDTPSEWMGPWAIFAIFFATFLVPTHSNRHVHVTTNNTLSSHITMPGIKGVTQAKVITDVLFHLHLVVMGNFVDFNPDWIIWLSIYNTNSPLEMTCGKTRFIHSTSQVCAIECSMHDTVVMPTTLWVLSGACSMCVCIKE